MIISLTLVRKPYQTLIQQEINPKFKGWYKGKTKPGTLTTTKTPSYAVTYDDKDDMTAVYEEVQPTAEMTVSRLLEVIPNEASMMWIVKLKIPVKFH